MKCRHFSKPQRLNIDHKQPDNIRTYSEMILFKQIGSKIELSINDDNGISFVPPYLDVGY